MKREFGRKLIEQFLANLDLSLVVDTSGAYIPGHGTPTVLLFGHNGAQSTRRFVRYSVFEGSRLHQSTLEKVSFGLTSCTTSTSRAGRPSTCPFMIDPGASFARSPGASREGGVRTSSRASRTCARGASVLLSTSSRAGLPTLAATNPTSLRLEHGVGTRWTRSM